MIRVIRNALVLTNLALAARPVSAQQVLKQIDSVVVKEREGAFLGKMGTIILVVLQQASSKNDDVVSAIRRFKIDPKQCQWKPL